LAVAIAPAPTSVFPAPQGSTTTPEPPCQKLDRVRLPVDVTREVLGRPAELQQRLLDLAALGGMHGHRVRAEAGADQRGDLLRTQYLFEHRAVRAGQHQTVRGVLAEREPPVAGHRLGHIDQQRVRYGVAAVRDERVHDLLGVVPGRAGVPQAQRGHPVGVDVLRRALQLRERRDGAAARTRVRVVDLQQ
jgi:hypothetical protein